MGGGGGAGAGAQGAGGKKQVESHFSIQLVKFGDSDPAYDKFMEAARDRWQNVIVGDVYDIRGVSSDQLFLDVFKGIKPTPEIPGVVDIDDIVIGYQFAKMDGRGEVLGGTFIIQSRTDDIGAFPVSAAMTFDIADVKAMAKDGSFETVVLHEMGHALGFSADMWASFESKCGKTCKVFDAGTPHGCKASDKYKALGLPGQLALDHSGKPKDGSYCAHWDEATLGDELMTPYMNTGGANPLTAITIAAFEDMGYTVNYDAADSAELISPAPANWREHTVSRMLQRRRQAPQHAPGRLGPQI
ncbi:hypothetical protein JKP88DRAFT_261971 [Tribonema minus]|uniref:Leishmanolysin n=1 Tax=Tribonema minus TaxID=303371 RepID=A0A836CL50_9STRA|nr:hypothetical protein JKP88DRAFT_261971 [Tribonema minus]